MGRRLLLLTAILAAAVPTILPARGEGESGQPPESMFEGLEPLALADDWEIGTPGGEFTVGVVDRIETFNPARAETKLEHDLSRLLFTRLFERNQFTLEWEPALAESLSLSEDGTEITITLKSDLTWSDGTPLTAEDVVYSVHAVHMRAAETGSNYERRIVVADRFTEWEAVDRLTIRVTAQEPVTDPWLLSSVPVLPKHIIEPMIEPEDQAPSYAAVSQLWGVEDANEVVGNGPFVLDTYTPGDRIVLEANASYYGKDGAGKPLPYLETITILLLETQEELLEQFVSGATDRYLVPGDELSAILEDEASESIAIYEAGPAPVIEFFAINMNPVESADDNGIPEPPYTWLDTREFRLALSHIADRERLIDEYVFGLAYPVFTFIPAFSPFYLAPEAPRLHDMEAATALLDELGFIDTDEDGIREDTDGNPLSLMMMVNEENEVRLASASLYAEIAFEAGIEVIVETVDYETYLDRLLERYDWQLAAVGLESMIDPGLSDLMLPSTGELHLHEPRQEKPRRDWERKIDESFAKNLDTADLNERRRLLREIEALWLDAAPVIYLYSTVEMEAFKSGWGNLYPRSVPGHDWVGLAPRIYQKEP